MPIDQTAGVGNTGNTTYYAQIRIEIPVKIGASLVVTTMAGFTAGVEHVGMGLLGQRGFFETFPALFNHRERLLTIYA